MQNTRRRHAQAPGIEGSMARWYARQRGSAPQRAAVRQSAARLAERVPAGGAVLEVAFGPGYLAIELARLGFAVSGLDISRTLVEIATDNAREAGVRLDLHQGDAAALPFADESFDLIVCVAAFKNFGRPGEALNEMHRVLRAGGTAVIEDMNKEASNADIDQEVRGMGLGRLNSLLTKFPLRHLRRRAYSATEFRQLAATTTFGTCEVITDGITLEACLTKPPSP
jgi:ubiquinone/menaquinone biosynthesis C-methylase UbiE